MSGETASGWPYLTKDDEPRDYPPITRTLAEKLEEGSLDHGALSGLDGDDHPQYFNEFRGDARYPLKAHTHDTRYLQPNQVLAGAGIFMDTTTTPGSVIVSAGAASEGLQIRDTASKTTSTVLAPTVREATTVTLTATAAYRLYRITTSSPARVQIYTTAAKQAADSGRPIGVDPTGNHGLLLEYITTPAILTADLSPTVDGFDGKDSPDGVIPITISNAGATPATITVDLLWIRTE